MKRLYMLLPIALLINIATASGQTFKDCVDCPEMVKIPAGIFEMGSEEEADERPIHRVKVSSFLIGRTEVTQGQWKAVMGIDPSRFSHFGDDSPVEQISWDDAKAFAHKLSQKTGKNYRLPSEAEWEYAARAGTTTKWSFGDSDDQLAEYGWHIRNSFAWHGQNRPQRAAQRKFNAFGLFDMHGNVWEWVEDCYHVNYREAPTDGSAWTTACSNSNRVLRGGSWIDFSVSLRSAYRNGVAPGVRYSYVGVRIARTP